MDLAVFPSDMVIWKNVAGDSEPKHMKWACATRPIKEEQ